MSYMVGLRLPASCELCPLLHPSLDIDSFVIHREEGANLSPHLSLFRSYTVVLSERPKEHGGDDRSVRFTSNRTLLVQEYSYLGKTELESIYS
jgi:hypothetical protein